MTILLFNTALASHKRAILIGRYAYYERAIGLYRQANSSIAGVDLANSPSYIPILAAVLFNQLVIHTEFYQRDEVRTLRGKLVSLFRWDGSLTMDQTDGVFFHLNLYLGVTEDFRLAPAA